MKLGTVYLLHIPTIPRATHKLLFASHEVETSQVNLILQNQPEVVISRRWDNVTEEFLKMLLKRKNAPLLCPICHPKRPALT